MGISAAMNTPPAPGTGTEAPGMLKRIAGLLVGIALIIVFIFYLAPWLEKPLGMEPLAKFIDEREINANVYFYTEVEEFSEANAHMNNIMAYPPRPAP